jgi:hypothetical protein
VEDYAQSGFGIGILEWREPHDLITDTIA